MLGFKKINVSKRHTRWQINITYALRGRVFETISRTAGFERHHGYGEAVWVPWEIPQCTQLVYEVSVMNVHVYVRALRPYPVLAGPSKFI